MKSLALNLLILSFTINSGQLLGQDWKTDAQARIDSIRKSTIHVSLENIPNDRIEDVEIKVYLRKHAFRWGTSVSISEVRNLIVQGFPVGSDHPYYNHFRHFNSVTVENAGKWKGWINDSNRKIYRQVRAWLNEEGIDSRGHGTIWESVSFNAIPDFILNATDTAMVRASIRSHIEEQLAELAGEVYELDLVNEPVHENKIVNGILKVDNIAEERAKWHMYARSIAPELPLVINEFDLIQSGNSFHEDFVSYVKSYQEFGGPVDIIGMQGHFFGTIPSSEELQKRIDEVKVLGLPMHVTEFDMAGSNYDEMARIMYACYSEPMMDGFTMWGAWDGAQWRGNAPVFNRNWTLKESGKAWFDLVHKKWKTDTSFFATGRNVYFSGYQGSHEIQINFDGRSLVIPFDLSSDTADLHIDMAQVINHAPTLIIDQAPNNVNCVGQPISFAVRANDQDGKVSGIHFYVNGRISNSFSGDSANTNLQFQETGEYTVRAEAIDDKGARTLSTEYVINVAENNLGESFSISFPPSGIGNIPGTPIDLQLDWNKEDHISELFLMDPTGNITHLWQEIRDTVTIETQGLSGAQTFTIGAINETGCIYSEDFNFYSYQTGNDQNFNATTIRHTNHDIEEKSNRSIDLEGDLDIGDKIIGLYFEDVYLPADAVIDSAFIQFTVEKDNQEGLVSVNITAELSSHPKILGGNTRLTDRDQTRNSVVWDIPSWSESGERTSAQRTPNLAPLLNEVLNHGNRPLTSPLVFVLTPNGQGAKRSAFSYDQAKQAAPELLFFFHLTKIEQPEIPTGLSYESTNNIDFDISWNPVDDSDLAGYNLYLSGKLISETPVVDTHSTLNFEKEQLPAYLSVSAVNFYQLESDRSSEIAIDLVLNIVEDGIADIYPNPSEGRIVINSPEAIRAIEIYDQSGKLVYSNSLHTHLNTESIELTLDHPGIYVLKLVQIDGRTKSKSVVIK